MSGAQEPSPAVAVQALCAAFYCLHDLLVAKGAFAPGEVAWHLTRLRGGPDDYQAVLHEIARNLHDMPFKPMDGPALAIVVDNDQGGD